MPDLSLRLIGQRKVHLNDAAFVRDGRALYAYWYPANLQEGWTPRKIDVQISTARDAIIVEPVLIEPLTGRVFALKPTNRTGDALTFSALPLMDCPLIVTDHVVVRH